jgi:hypothetical protein
MRYLLNMRPILKTAAMLGGVLLVNTALAVPANLRENYQPIVDRNPFGLRPPPPPPTNNVAQPPPVEKPKMEIFLTGIVSIGQPKKQVYLKTQEANKKDAVQYYALPEGAEKDGIRVLSIDERERRVRVQIDGAETVLSFQTHGIAAAAPPPLAAPGMMPGQPGAMPGQPGAVPPPLPGAMPGQAMQGGNAQFPQNPSVQPMPAMNTGGNAPNNFRSIPSRSVRSQTPNRDFMMGTPNAGGGVPGMAEQQAPAVDPAEQYLRMHLDKTQKERQGIPMPPLPPP